MHNIGRVYVITNQRNGKKYVGFTNRSVLNRWKCHVSGDRRGAKALHEAIVEFGADAFTIETVFEGTCEEAIAMEPRLIRELNTIADGYNRNVGGQVNFIGKKHKPESIALMVAAATTGEPLSAEHRAKISAALKGQSKSREHAAHIGAAKRGNKYFLGRSHTPEAKAKMRAYTPTPEHRAKISAAMRGNTNGKRT